MGTTYDFKGKAKKLFNKLRDDSPSPPLANPRPEQGLSEHFDALNLGGKLPPPKPYTPQHRYTHSQPNVNAAGFIGGFKPSPAPSTPNSLRPLPSPPPAMPTAYVPAAPQQQSMTMQYALQPHSFRPDNWNPPPPLPHTPPRRPSSRPQQSSVPLHSGGGQHSASPARPTPTKLKPTRPRAQSTPPTPDTSVAATAAGLIQCSGQTLAGNRCGRKVKERKSALAAYVDDSDDNEPVKLFCHQHAKEVLKNTGFNAPKIVDGHPTSEWVSFDDWIPHYLHEDTQAALRVLMNTMRSQKDAQGYIYTFEIRDPSAHGPIKLKVGRTVNLVKRLKQWDKKCGSKEQVLRGFYPGSVDAEDDSPNDNSLMKGLIKASDERVWANRLERLIHLELADLAVNKAYLQPGWKSFTKGPNQGKKQMRPAMAATALSDDSTGSGTPGKKKAKFVATGVGNGGYKPCDDCGTVHKEIFEFERVKKGVYKGNEYDLIVKKVIEGWGQFVQTYI